MNPLGFAESLSLFVDVVQDKSFSAAARRRGLAASSVARQIGHDSAIPQPGQLRGGMAPLHAALPSCVNTQ